MSLPDSLDDIDINGSRSGRQRLPAVQWSELQRVAHPSRGTAMAFSTPSFDRSTSGIGGFGNPRPARIAASHSQSSSAGDLAPSSGILKPAPALKQEAPATPVPLITQDKTQLLDHIQRSLLTGDCADVRIRVERWGVVYHLHRMVLVQAGFFHSLFLGGFSESSGGSSLQRHRQTSLRSNHSSSSRGGLARGQAETLELTLDDDNITRAAFEICISRLYSSHPTLHVDPAWLPTLSHPLTASFPNPPSVASSADLSPDAQPTSPRLLLSVLATAIYLGQNDLIKQSLGLILASISPWSVGRYLEFAIGSGIGEEEYEGQDADPARGLEGIGRPLARSSATVIPPRDRRRSTDDIRVKVEDTDGDDGQKCSDAGEATQRSSPEILKGQITDAQAAQHVDGSGFPADDFGPRRYFYGFAGDKIGEACACWLARWATDILEVEESMAAMQSSEQTDRGRSLAGLAALTLGGSSKEFGKGKGAERRAKSVSWQLQPAQAESDTATFSSPLCIWSRGGLPAHWVRAVVSADALFVRNEMERYRFAKRVLALRRMGRASSKVQAGADIGVKEEEGDSQSWTEEDEEDEEELELQEIFRSGIYYSHMSFTELNSMSGDINGYTGAPYVPLNVLQSALWAAQDLQSRITSYKADGTLLDARSSSLSGRSCGDSAASAASEVGGRSALALSTSEILNEIRAASQRLMSPRRVSARVLSRDIRSGTVSSRGSPSPVPQSPTPNLGGFGLQMDNASTATRSWWPVPSDSTLRIGDAISPTVGFSPSQPLPDLGPALGDMSIASDSNAKAPLNEKLFFGIGSRAKTGAEIESIVNDPVPSEEISMDTTWSSHEPFRFAVEFWGITNLGEKQRAYSTTQFYAGSYFNIYVQTIKKKDKGVQLGIYLHRQSMLEPLPVPSTPLPRSAMSSNDWNASSPAVGSLSGRLGGDDLAMHRTMSFTPVGSPPASASPGDNADDALATMSTRRDNAHRRAIDAPHSPYRDPRNVSRVYFSISCASALGTALTRFSSGPDNFSVSQSWGWKSSSLRSQEYLAGGPSGAGPSLSERLDEGVLGWVSDVYPSDVGGEGGWKKRDLRSLRATVVMGVL